MLPVAGRKYGNETIYISHCINNGSLFPFYAKDEILFGKIFLNNELSPML
jgi:hypothetical protein